MSTKLSMRGLESDPLPQRMPNLPYRVRQRVQKERATLSRAMSRLLDANDHKSSPRGAYAIESPVASRPTKRANILQEEDIQQVFDYIASHSPVPESDYCKVTLSFFAGLRASEIATLRMAHVTDAIGEISKMIEITPRNGKGGRGRTIRMHPMIATALRAYQKRYPDADHIAVSGRYGNNTKPQSTNALTVYMWRLYRKAGLVGCSSHSGRRTCLTAMARNLPRGQSLHDVQIFAGHARLDTTENYLEPADNMDALINAIVFSSRKETHRD